MQIAEEKKEAIYTTEGPLLVIAGPGSGKTRTLVERVVHLVSEGVEPTCIMVSTFTEKAAAELVTRISNRLLERSLKVNLNEMFIGTLHSIFLRILDDNREFSRLKRNYRILDQFDQRYLIFRKMRDLAKVPGVADLLPNFPEVQLDGGRAGDDLHQQSQRRIARYRQATIRH